MDDLRDPAWKFVISHEPRSKREIEEYDHTNFAGTGNAPDTLGLFPVRIHSPVVTPSTAQQSAVGVEVPIPAVEVLDAIELQPKDDAFFEDDQYEDDYVLYEGP